VVDRVEHQGDPGERLDGAVVEHQREAAPLVLLAGDPLFELADALALILAALTLSPLMLRLRRQ
jgi:hypothetical protein